MCNTENAALKYKDEPIKQAKRRFAFASSFFAVFLAGCGSCGQPLPDAPTSGGDGAVVVNGAPVAYTLDAVKSRFLIVVYNKPEQVGCGFFHSHVVQAESIILDFTLDETDPANSNLTATIAASGLNPDAPDLRDEILGDPALSDSDRASIKTSVLDQVSAADFPRLVFDGTHFSTLTNGESGILDVAVSIGGADQTIQMTYEYIYADNGDIELHATGVLPGEPHGIPNGFASDCVKSDLDLILDLFLVQGTRDAPATLTDAGIQVFEPTQYPFEGSCDENTISFNEVRDVLVRKCASCHNSPVRLGATIPLTEYSDFRVDTQRNPDIPLYQTIGVYINLEEGQMPPDDSPALSTEEKQLALDWIAQGGPDCLEQTAPKEFAPIESKNCGMMGYNDIKDVVETYCIGCHHREQTALSFLETYDDGLSISAHPYYSGITTWEAALYRMEDQTMPPYAMDFPIEATDLERFKRWIEMGYPENKCNN